MAEGTVCARHVLGWNEAGHCNCCEGEQILQTRPVRAVTVVTAGSWIIWSVGTLLTAYTASHPKKTEIVNLLQENHKMRVPFVGVSYEVLKKKKKYFCGDVINPPDPVPESTKFGSALLNSEFPDCQLRQIRPLLEGINDFLPHYRYCLTDMGGVPCRISPHNAVGQTWVSWISVQWQAHYT
jgi:hypothetical protein